MAGTLKSLLVALGVDSKGFNKGMDAAEKKSKRLEKTFSGLANIGKATLLGAGAAAVGVGVALASTVGPATDLEEAINAVNVVFGEGSKQIIDFSKNSSMAIGLSSREFNQMSAEMGAMLGNVGIAEGELGTETITLMKRASDMASIFNTDVSQAFGAIQSAIKGEFNPLEAFGVKMNQARIDAKALAMGLVETSVDATKVAEASMRYEKAVIAADAAMTKYGKDHITTREAVIKQAKALEGLETATAGVTGEITDAAKAQAALALVYEQTDKVAGDFQNTSGGLANSQRQLAGILEDTKAQIGAGLTPALAGLAVMAKDFAKSDEFQTFLEKVTEGVGKLGEWIAVNVPIMIKNFRKFVDFLKNNKGIIVGVLAAVGVALVAFGIQSAIAMAPMLPVIAIMLAVAAVAYLVYEAWTNNWGGIQERVATSKEFIMGIIQGLVAGITAIWNTLMTVLRPIIEAFQAAIAGDWYTFGEKLREAWDTVWELISTAVSTAWENIKLAISELITNTIAFFTETDWGEIGINIIQGIADGLTGAVGIIKTAATNAASAAWNAAKGFLGIGSPSKLFAELGKFSMMGMAGGIDDYARVPAMATADATRGIATTAGQADYPAAAPAQPVLDEAKLARMIRDAILKVMEL